MGIKKPDWRLDSEAQTSSSGGVCFTFPKRQARSLPFRTGGASPPLPHERRGARLCGTRLRHAFTCIVSTMKLMANAFPFISSAFCSREAATYERASG
jgi:hypothetical protein